MHVRTLIDTAQRTSIKRAFPKVSCPTIVDCSGWTDDVTSVVVEMMYARGHGQYNLHKGQNQVNIIEY